MEILVALAAVMAAIPAGGFLRRRFSFGDREWRASRFLPEVRHRLKLEQFPERLTCCGGGKTHSER